MATTPTSSQASSGAAAASALSSSSSNNNNNNTTSSSKGSKDSKAAANSNNANSTDNADKHKRFENEGVVFKAKLIGSELVMEPRGDKMCQNSIQRLKAIIKGTNSHKKRIVLKISYDGVKVYDEKTNEILHHHEVSQISYIASDDTDNRTFGYVSDVPNKAHQFICFKTTGPAISVMSVISALFEAVLERKNKAEREEKDGGKAAKDIISTQDSADLIGDSGIMEGDASIISDLTNEKSTPYSQLTAPMSNQSAGSILDSNIIASPADSFNSFSNSNSNRAKQQTSTDLMFDDLFAGLSDPIIVDKNDSLISYKHGSGASQLGDAFNLHQQVPQQQQPIQQSQPQSQLQLHNQPQQSQLKQAQRIGETTAPNLPFPIPRRQNQPHRAVLLPPPSSLPRPGPTMMSSSVKTGEQPASHNRSLVYNHSSVSLSDAPLTHQPSFTSTWSAPNNGHVDRYAVFNDIDNLPSIFESTSLGSVNAAAREQSMQSTLGGSGIAGGPVAASGEPHFSSTSRPSFQLASANNSFSQSFNHSYLQQSSSSNSMAAGAGSSGGRTLASTMGHSASMAESSMFRQTNPFDDDFFA